MPNGHHPHGPLVVASPLARLNYFYGQLLAERDLVAEQAYHVALRRLVQRELFGTGTTAGLAVEPSGASQPRSVVLRPGLGLDQDGRELIVDEDVMLEVAEAPVDDDPPDPLLTEAAIAGLATELEGLYGHPMGEAGVRELDRRLIDVGLVPLLETTGRITRMRDLLNRVSPPADLTLPPGRRLVDYLFDSLVGTTYVGLRYSERGAEPTAAVLDGSCCGEVRCFPSRLQQGVSVILQREPFAPVQDPAADARRALSACLSRQENPTPEDLGAVEVGSPHACGGCLTDHVLASWRRIPPDLASCASPALAAVPLAAVYWLRLDAEPGTSRVLLVDNRRYRPLAPGVPTIRALVEAVTQCVPPIAIAPTLVEIAPAHGERLVVADGATEVELRATADTRLDDGLTPRWEIDVYPAAPGSTTESYDSDGTPPWDVAVAVTNNGPRGEVTLRLTDPSGGAVTLVAGTYVWRLNFRTGPGVSDIQAERTGQSLDGDPNPLTAVPGGDGTPGGELEARFYVTEG